MLQRTEKEQFLFKKSYEIGYALFRIAAKMEEKHFSEKLYRFAADLLEDALALDEQGMFRSLDSIRGFISFGNDVNIIHAANVEVMLREIRALEASLAEWHSEKEKLPPRELDLGSFFSQDAFASQGSGRVRGTPVKKTAQEESFRDAEDSEESGGSGDLRQTAILEKIRQIGDCRLKDIQEILPEYSERTIRYDIQSLLGKELIERIGNGGPAVFYRIRQTA